MVFLTTQFWTGRSPSSSSSSKTDSRPEKTHPMELLYRRFSLDAIKSATQNFDNSLVVGRGGFGKVYKGVIDNKTAAIKRLDSWSNQGATEFWTEIEMLSRLRHRNLVSLIGYCNDEDELILVYEFVPLGSLNDHLHGNGMYLSWMQRLNICLGAARGLEYLHDMKEGGVIHRDVKSSNILLELNWVAKVSDFGLSKIGLTNQAASFVNTFVKGTFGYLDPNYLLTGQVTRKSDVYAFGVVLFEVLCGRPAADASLPREQRNLARWAQDSIKEGKLKAIIDSSVMGQISPKCLKKFAHIASQCLHYEPKERPTMAEVVTALDSALGLQEKTESSIANFSAPTDKSSMAFTMKMKNFFLPSVGAKARSKKIKAAPVGTSVVDASKTEPSIATTSASLPASTTETIPATVSGSPSPLYSFTSTLVGASTSTIWSSISQEFPVTQPITQHLPITSTMTSSTREGQTLETPAKGSEMKLALQNLASEMAALSLSKTSAPQPSSSVPFVMPLELWKSNKALVEGVWVHQDYEKLWTKIVALHPSLLSNLHVSSDLMKSMAAEEVCFLISTIAGPSAMELHPSLVDLWDDKLKDLGFLGVDIEPLKKKQRDMAMFIDEIRERQEREENAKTVKRCRDIFEEAERLFNMSLVELETATLMSTVLRERHKERCEYLGADNSLAVIEMSKGFANEYM